MLNGLTDIWEFAGGLKAWLEQGLATERKPNAQVLEQPISGPFLLDAEKSVIKWAGSNLTNSHTGTLGFTGGALRLREGQHEDAKFQIDMKSLACEDIKDAERCEINQMLVRHLSSDDFFDVAIDNLCEAGGIRLGEPPPRLRVDAK